jgi:hypothetical protein
MGTPYDVEIASAPGELTVDRLQQSNQGRYQGIVLTTGNLAFSSGSSQQSALSDAEWQTLWSYEAAFRVRQVTWYTYPTADYGFGPAKEIDTSAAPITASLTAAGAGVFAHVNAAAPVVLRDVWAYRAAPQDSTTTPLLRTAAGDALAAIHTYPDGRENLAMTFDGNQFLVHSLQLAYDAINWVTRGLFLGERHVYMGVQVDDLFLDSDIWPIDPPKTYRMTGHDLDATVAWQNARRAQPLTAGLRLDLAFNGEGTTSDYAPDTLTPRATALQSEFKWISHTYTHQNLDAVSYALAHTELEQNLQVASALGLARFRGPNLVTPEISGLNHLPALQAMFDVGIRYLVSDTSRAGQDNPTPNAGIYNIYQPAILEIPRRPTNLFYNVSTPAEWAGEYNEFYRTYWGRDLTYQEILGVESEALLRYLLRFDMDPWMFHQANLRAYNASKTLLTDLLDVTITRYTALVNLPILSPEMNELGQRMADRMNYNAAGVRAIITPGASLSITADRAARVPVTGLNAPIRETYGGQVIGYVDVQAGQTVTIPLQGGAQP